MGVVGGMAEVFISYSQKDRARIAPIAAALEELGIDAWYDREISAGQSFGAVIRGQLKEAQAVLVCWSPDAIASDWVDAEADHARESGAYLPVFIAPCALMPPFNRIHTDDLSKWTGGRGDSEWLKLVDSLARMIGREAVSAGARALAAGDEASKYAFARRYPDEKLAKTFWASAEARLRGEFSSRLTEARAAAKARLEGERAVLEARLNAATPAFEAWLADERVGAAKGEKPDPLKLVGPETDGGEQALHERIDALSGALAQANARARDIEKAKAEAAAEAARLAVELKAAQASTSPPARGGGRLTWALSALVGVLALALVGVVVRDANAPTPAPNSMVVDKLQADLDSAKRGSADAEAGAAKLQGELDTAKRAAADATANAAKLHIDLTASQAQAASAAADAQRAQASATDKARQLADATAALAAAKDQIAKLQASLAARQAQTLAPLASRTPVALSAAEERVLKPKDVVRECVDCPAMVVLPAGTFTMGSPDSEAGRFSDEGPQHDVRIAAPFAVGKFDVTKDEFAAFVKDTGYNSMGSGWQNPGFTQTGSDPVVKVSWGDANAYAKWLSTKTSATYRLLSESEWEYAARAGTTTAYFWGDAVGKNNANCNGCGSPWDNKQTSPVGSFAPNAFGLYDMHGDVWQWVQDCYRDSYNGAPNDGSPIDSGECGRRVFRGGSWYSLPRGLRATDRDGFSPSNRYIGLGFRVARTLPP